MFLPSQVFENVVNTRKALEEHKLRDRNTVKVTLCDCNDATPAK
jgi:hypothetical protein